MEKAARERLARIRRYRQMKKIKNYRRNVQINAIAAKMLAYISVPAVFCSPAQASDESSGNLGNTFPKTEISFDEGLKRHMFLTIVGRYNIDTAVQNIVSSENEEFLKALNRQYDDIKSKGAGRRDYTRSLFGPGNYCNMAVIRVLKQTGDDYMNGFLNNLNNPALCEAFISYVKKAHPDCIRYEAALTAGKLKKGDIVVTRVARNDKNGARTLTGNHTVTFDGEKFVSFNSESKYNVSGRGFVIDINKIREKELSGKIKSMKKEEAVAYLLNLSAKYKDKKQEKETPFLSPFNRWQAFSQRQERL